MKLHFLLSSQFEDLASLDRNMMFHFAVFALETKHNLLGCLGFLTENRLGLTTKTFLLHIVTALSCIHTYHDKCDQ